jgi:hypothetical protein
MAFKLIEAAQARWRCVNAPHLVALVRAGAVFRAGVLVERPEPAAALPSCAATSMPPSTPTTSTTRRCYGTGKSNCSATRPPASKGGQPCRP